MSAQRRPNVAVERPRDVLRALEAWGSAHDWVAPDPYEGLNSRLGRTASTPRLRQGVIQAYKRLPVIPRGPLGAAPMENAKALGLVLSAYTTPAGRSLPGAADRLVELSRRIAALNLDLDAAAWGYHFDVQTRHLFYGRDTANAIATCFAVGGLLDAAKATGARLPFELALAARPFLLSLRHDAPGLGSYFAYVSGGSELIHNANMLVCAALSRLQRLEPDDLVAEAVQAAAETTLDRQRDDGLWDYGEASNLRWIDNFHTAYILESLLDVDEVFGIGRGAWLRGAQAWRDAFIDGDGWARYYPARRTPLETHCCASAIDLLCELDRRDPSRGWYRVGEAVAATAIRELWMPELGCFGFRRGRAGLNKRQFMRWTNAPMFRALARICSRAGEREDGPV